MEHISFPVPDLHCMVWSWLTLLITFTGQVSSWILTAKTHPNTIQWWKHFPDIFVIINYSYALLPVICVHFYLTLFVYSVTCHIWSKCTMTRPLPTFYPSSSCFLPWHSHLDAMERSHVHPWGTELYELMEVNLLKVHFLKEQRSLHTKREKYQANILGLCSVSEVEHYYLT